MHFQNERIFNLQFARTPYVSIKSSKITHIHTQKHKNRSRFIFLGTCILFRHVRIDNFKIVLLGCIADMCILEIDFMVKSRKCTSTCDALHCTLTVQITLSLALSLSLNPILYIYFCCTDLLTYQRVKTSLWDRFIFFFSVAVDLLFDFIVDPL